jgi:multidrug transporter EmrE-like cation transporter
MITPIFYGFAMSVVDIIMETLCKYYSISASKPVILLIFAVLTYSFQPLLFTKALKYEGMGVTNVIWNVVSTGLIVLIGAFIFGEKMNNYKITGVFLSIISLVLLSI